MVAAGKKKSNYCSEWVGGGGEGDRGGGSSNGNNLSQFGAYLYYVIA